MDPKTAERDLDTLGKDFDRLGVKVLERLDVEAKERTKIGKATEETGKKMDKLNENWEQVVGDMAGIKSQLDEMTLERKRQEMFGGGIALPDDALTQFLASEQYKAFAGDKGLKATVPFVVEGGMFVPRPGSAMAPAVGQRGEKALTSTELAGLLDAFRWQQVVMDPLRPRRLLDLVPSVDVGNVSSVEYPRENVTREIVGYLYSQAASGQADLILGVERDETQTDRSLARGFKDGSTVTIAPGAAAEEEGVIDSIDHTTGTITLSANLTNTHAAGIKVTSTTFVFTPEAEIKPLAEVGVELATASIKTLASGIPITKQIAKNAQMLSGYLRGRQEEFLELALEDQVLNGDSTNSDEIGGILNDSDIGTYLQANGNAGDSKLDAIRRSFTVVFLSFFPADAFAIHPNDWEDVETLKGSNGQYVFAQIQTAAGVQRVWRAVPVETPVITELTSLSGSFRLGCMLWNAMAAIIRIFDQHKDWARTNKLLYLIERELGFSIIRPAAFCKTTLTNSPVV